MRCTVVPLQVEQHREMSLDRYRPHAAFGSGAVAGQHTLSRLAAALRRRIAAGSEPQRRRSQAATANESRTRCLDRSSLAGQTLEAGSPRDYTDEGERPARLTPAAFSPPGRSAPIDRRVRPLRPGGPRSLAASGSPCRGTLRPTSLACKGARPEAGRRYRK